MRMWIGVGILAAFGTAVVVWPAPDPARPLQPQRQPAPIGSPEPQEPLRTQEELIQDARQLHLPEPPPLGSTKDDGKAYLERLDEIAKASNPEVSKEIRRMKRQYLRAQNEAKRKARHEDVKRREEEQDAERAKERAEKKAKHRQPTPHDPPDPNAPPPSPVVLPPPLEGVTPPPK